MGENDLFSAFDDYKEKCVFQNDVRYIFRSCQLCVKLSDMDKFLRSLIMRGGFPNWRETETGSKSGILET